MFSFFFLNVVYILQFRYFLYFFLTGFSLNKFKHDDRTDSTAKPPLPSGFLAASPGNQKASGKTLRRRSRQITSGALAPGSHSQPVNQNPKPDIVRARSLTLSSWWRWERRWRGRSRRGVGICASWRCRCLPRMQSARLFLPSTWRMRPAGKAGRAKKKKKRNTNQNNKFNKTAFNSEACEVPQLEDQRWISCRHKRRLWIPNAPTAFFSPHWLDTHEPAKPCVVSECEDLCQMDDSGVCMLDVATATCVRAAALRHSFCPWHKLPF